MEIARDIDLSFAQAFCSIIVKIRLEERWGWGFYIYLIPFIKIINESILVRRN